MSPGSSRDKGQNGGRAGLWLSIAFSAAMLLSMIGSVFYVAFNGKSNTDGLALQGAQLHDLAEKQAAIQDRMTKIEVSLNEIETQFCAQDVVRNLMHANDQRIASMLWQRVFDTKIPTDNTYYPTICNRRVQ